MTVSRYDVVVQTAEQVAQELNIYPKSGGRAVQVRGHVKLFLHTLRNEIERLRAENIRVELRDRVIPELSIYYDPDGTCWTGGDRGVVLESVTDYYELRQYFDVGNIFQVERISLPNKMTGQSPACVTNLTQGGLDSARWQQGAILRHSGVVRKLAKRELT